MNASLHFGTYVAILRKHLLLLLISAGVVVGAGILYVNEQEPRYRATADLTITRPQRMVIGSQGTTDILNIDRKELQTEIYLLRKDSNLARQVLAEASEAGIPVGDEYDPEELPSLVSVDFVPGTEVVEFSIEGGHAESLPALTNLYADRWGDQFASQSQRKFQEQLAELEKRVGQARQDADVSATALSDFQKANGTHDLSRGANRHTEERRNLAARVAARAEQDHQRRERVARVRAELEALGVSVEERGDRFVLSTTAGGESLEQRLATSGVLASVDVVQVNPEVTHYLGLERAASLRDAELASTASESSKERQALARQIDEARRARGRAIARTLESMFLGHRSWNTFVEAEKQELQGAERDEEALNKLMNAYAVLAADAERAERELERQQGRLEQLQAMYATQQASEDADATPSWRINVQVGADRAVQIAPNKPLILALTAFTALGVALGLVFLVEFLDDTIKSREDFDRYVGLPFLGFIPHIPSSETKDNELVADAKPGSAIAESFRTLRTSVLFSRGDRRVETILITSAGPGEGKTTVASNLAATLAKQKGPVLLIDADLRRPRVHKALGLTNDRGLTNYLIGDAKLDDLLQETTVEGLLTMTSGPIPPNPAELLHGERMVALIEEAKGRFDRIVIDSPPLIAVTDARVLSRIVDGLYLVISMGKTSRRLIQRSIESITSIDCEVHGSILNNLTMPTGRYGYYYYRDYSYGGDYYRDPKQGADKSSKERS